MSEQLELYLKGGRYDAVEGLPLELLPTLRHVGELLHSVARDLYFAEHPDRHRVPMGFESSFTPALTQLTGGSASCVVSGWDRVPERQRHFHEAARGELMSLLAVAADPALVWPEWCSPESQRAIVESLSLLEEGETLRCRTGADLKEPGPAVTVGFSARVNAQRAVARGRVEGSTPFSLVGRIVRLEKEPWAIGLKLREGDRPVRVPIDESLIVSAQGEFQANAEHLTLVRGLARPLRQGAGRQYVVARSLERIGGPAIGARLKELVELPVGWFDEEPESKPPSRAFARDIERQLWALIETLGCPRPSLFPTPEGCVEALWRHPTTTVTLLFGLTPRTVQATVVDLAAGVAVDSPDVPTLAALHGWLTPHLGGPR